MCIGKVSEEDEIEWP